MDRSAAAESAPIVSREEAIRRRQSWQRAGEAVVLTNGCFDLLHLGHIRYLQAACRLGRLIVGLNADQSVRDLKGPTRPVVGQSERAAVLAALRCVELVTIFTEPTAEALLEAIRPNIYVKGADYAPGAHPWPEAETARRIGTRVETIPLIQGYSTTALIKKIRTDGAGGG